MFTCFINTFKYSAVSECDSLISSNRFFVGGSTPFAIHRKYAADQDNKSYGCVRITSVQLKYITIRLWTHTHIYQNNKFKLTFDISF